MLEILTIPMDSIDLEGIRSLIVVKVIVATTKLVVVKTSKSFLLTSIILGPPIEVVDVDYIAIMLMSRRLCLARVSFLCNFTFSCTSQATSFSTLV